MTVATIDDAIEFLTDPELRAMGRRRADGRVPMRPEVVSRLQQRGATEREARLLIADALQQLDGKHEQRRVKRQSVGGASRWVKYHEIEVFWIPEAALRSTSD